MDNYIIIIGSMKSGTTTLFNVLANHSKIAPAKPKEPGFFAFDAVWAKGYDWYHTLFDFDASRHHYRLEASTDYTKVPFATGVWDRMTAVPGKRFKLIYVMRNPITRMESHARHTQKTRKELGQIVSDRPDHSLEAGVSLISMAASQYASQLDQFAQARAQGDLHILTFEALRDRPQETLAGVFDFLELEPEEQPEALPQHNLASQRKETMALWKALSGNKTLMALGRAVLPKGARDSIKGLFRRKIKVDGRFAFTPAEHAAMAALLGHDIARLNSEYGVETEKDWDLPPRERP